MSNAIHKMMHGTIPFMKLSFQVMRGLPFGFSFNLSDRCPINCDCYWRASNRVTELSEEQVIKFFQEQKKKGKLLAVIVGGEPYVRPTLLDRVTSIMPANWLVTSGTAPLKILPRTTHFISIDGKDAETHNRVRKSKGLYERILHNLEVVRSQGNFPVFIHTVLNALNYEQIGEIIEVWKSNGLVDGIVFSTHTRIEGANDQELLLSIAQRAHIVNELLRQKERYGNFLCMTEEMIRKYYPFKVQQQTAATCSTAKYVESFDASGKKIPQCIFSQKGDCSTCGCVSSALISPAVTFLPSLATVKVLADLYTP